MTATSTCSQLPLALAKSPGTKTWRATGSTWSQVVISNAADGVVSVVAADVDGDGDIDALSASENDDKIAWYENLFGDGSSWSEHVISLNAKFGRTVYAADVNGDESVDVLSASAANR